MEEMSVHFQPKNQLTTKYCSSD